MTEITPGNIVLYNFDDLDPHGRPYLNEFDRDGVFVQRFDGATSIRAPGASIRQLGENLVVASGALRGADGNLIEGQGVFNLISFVDGSYIGPLITSDEFALFSGGVYAWSIDSSGQLYVADINSTTAGIGDGYVARFNTDGTFDQEWDFTVAADNIAGLTLDAERGIVYMVGNSAGNTMYASKIDFINAGSEVILATIGAIYNGIEGDHEDTFNTGGSGRSMTVNQATGDVYFYKSIQTLYDTEFGNRWRWDAYFSIFGPNEADPLIATYTETVHSGISNLDLSHPMADPDGSRVWFFITNENTDGIVQLAYYIPGDGATIVDATFLSEVNYVPFWIYTESPEYPGLVYYDSEGAEIYFLTSF